MARFRAFLTDSESEAEETTRNATTAAQPPAKPADVGITDDDSEEAGSASESESSQPSYKQRKRAGKAVVRLTDEKGHRAFKARRSESPIDPSASEESEPDSEDDESPPPNQPQVDPSLISRAQQLGVEPQRMHVMQASLFRLGDDAEGAPTRHRALALSSSLSLSRKHSRDSDGEGLRQDSQQVRARPVGRTFSHCGGLARIFRSRHRTRPLPSLKKIRSS